MTTSSHTNPQFHMSQIIQASNSSSLFLPIDPTYPLIYHRIMQVSESGNKTGIKRHKQANRKVLKINQLVSQLSVMSQPLIQKASEFCFFKFKIEAKSYDNIICNAVLGRNVDCAQPLAFQVMPLKPWTATTPPLLLLCSINTSYV